MSQLRVLQSTQQGYKETLVSTEMRGIFFTDMHPYLQNFPSLFTADQGQVDYYLEPLDRAEELSRERNKNTMVAIKLIWKNRVRCVLTILQLKKEKRG